MQQSDRFIDGTQSITPCLRPRFPGWHEVPVNALLLALGGVARAFLHTETGIAVQALEAMQQPGEYLGFSRDREVLKPIILVPRF